MYEDLSGKIAVVTGGARGLGYQMAGALAAHGVEIALLDVLPDVGDSAARLANEKSVRTVGVVADVTDTDSIGGAIAAVSGSLGVPSILVNAAGITAWGDSVDVTPDAWRRVIDVNLTGTFFSCQAFARAVFAGGGKGAIVNVSSMSAFVVNIPQRQTSYNASKAAVDQLTRSLAVECGFPRLLPVRHDQAVPGHQRRAGQVLGVIGAGRADGPAGRPRRPDRLSGVRRLAVHRR
jgi:NAD(P)-dependent dehydrogenase (short-subunit alcohol dehydrogenase family)